MSTLNFQPGLTGRIERIITNDDTAARYGSGLVPVLATPAMIGLMENTAQESIKAFLPDGFTTVGSHVDVKHLRPTPAGETVTCESILSEVKGQKLVFEVMAFDRHGMIGKGTHTRYIVEIRSFLLSAGLSIEQP